MNYYPFHIGEPFQSELKIAMKQRDESKTSKERSNKSACAWLEREQQQTSLFSQPARQGFQPSLLEAA